ncbi:MAG: methylated-DNA--[protein]-cysteine S-methyltransferase [Bryobacterales bacterium]|nr:methylated-DNA--[protein]-cysteine S-methyltransferase [Bryobacterales bacterium]
MVITREDLDSPIGVVSILSFEGAVIALDFADCEERMLRLLGRGWGVCELRVQLTVSDHRRRIDDYFTGDLAALDSIRTETRGTAFQQAVWAALREIPPGTAWSYLDLARRIGNEKAVRAVGAANGQNPIAIVHPCHRVVATSHALTGYAGGLHRKQWLLDHERSNSCWTPSGPLFA